MPPAASTASAAIQNQESPAMKNTADHEITTSMVWPRSGWATSSAATMASSSMAKMLPGMSLRREFSVKSQADSTRKAGLTNSDGCSERPRKLIQRRAPFTSWPMNSVRNISTIEIENTINAVRRTLRGDRNDVAIMTPIVGIMNRMWRFTK